MKEIETGPGEIVVKAFTGLFSVCESTKAIAFWKFPLKSGLLQAVLEE